MGFCHFFLLYEMNWLTLVGVLCLLRLASAECECGGGLQSFIPSDALIAQPNPFSGNDGRFPCAVISSSFHCNNITIIPLFNCSANDSVFYGWDSLLPFPVVTANFTRSFRSMNVLVTFLVSATANASVPESLIFSANLDGQASQQQTEQINLPSDLSVDETYLFNRTLSLGVMFNEVTIKVNPITSSQWVAINRIIFCAAATEDSFSSAASLSTRMMSLMPTTSPGGPVTASTDLSSAVTPTAAGVLTTVSTGVLTTVSTIVSTGVSTTMSTGVSTTVSTGVLTTVSTTVSTGVSTAVSTGVSTATSPTPSVNTSTFNVISSTTQLPTASIGANDGGEDTLPLALLVGVIVVAIFLFVIVLLLTVILCCVCHNKSHSDTFSLEGAPKPATLPEGYEMLTSDPLPLAVSNGDMANGMKKNDYDYPQLPMEVESSSNHVNNPYYSTPEHKNNKMSAKGSSATFPTNIDAALYEMPLVTASSKASFNKVIENGEPVYYMLDKKYSFYEKSKSLNALEEVDLQPYASIYDDPLPLKRSEAPNYVKPSDVREIKLLGNGQFGEVYLAEVISLSAAKFEGMDPSQGSPLQVAVKKLRGNSSDSMQKAFEKEIKFMSRLKHKHVIRLLGICTDASCPFIMIEYAKSGDLNRYLKSLKLADGNLPPGKGQITKLGLLSQCTQIVMGMEYLSSLNFIHRDLATRNILVGDWNQIKIADFGMSQNLYDSDYYRVKGHAIVPIRWMASECFYGRFSVKSDVWAFGVVVWEVFTMCSRRPYEEMSDAELIQDARHTGMRRLLQQTEHCPDQVYQVLLQCWRSMPAERANFTQLHDRFTRLCNGSV